MDFEQVDSSSGSYPFLPVGLCNPMAPVDRDDAGGRQNRIRVWSGGDYFKKAVKTTAFDLPLNPANPGMSFQKLDKARDRNF